MEVLRRPQVLNKVGFSRQTLYRRIADGSFPRPVRISRQAVGWIKIEVEDWLKSRPRAGRELDRASNPSLPMASIHRGRK